jgi:hypothetical protein
VRRATVQHKYGDLRSDDVRATLLLLTLEFIRAAHTIPGVTRIALVGSLLTAKAYPKDADVLVTMTADVDFERLARIGRRLKGRAQTINAGADVFLADPSGHYVGRICHYRECFPRRACRALNCGKVAHLNDDFAVVTLPRELLTRPPVVVFPTMEVGGGIPPDVDKLLIAPLKEETTAQSA